MTAEEKARKDIERDYEDDVLDAAGRTRELRRVADGEGKYLLRHKGLIARAAGGDHEAIVKLAIIAAAVFVLLIVIVSVIGGVLDLAAGGAGGGEFEDD